MAMSTSQPCSVTLRFKLSVVDAVKESRGTPWSITVHDGTFISSQQHEVISRPCVEPAVSGEGYEACVLKSSTACEPSLGDTSAIWDCTILVLLSRGLHRGRWEQLRSGIMKM
ncbi:tetratricopeptide repeat family [Moniliophthora roreri]|nr:tetratricopeptide repeat family [Moniliophthora roreri]